MLARIDGVRATYANWADQLLTPDEVAEMLPGFCAEVGIPATAAEFRADLQTRLDTQCRATDAAYPDLADFAIDDAGRPSLKQYRAAPPTASAQALALALRDRMPERTLMGIWPAPGTGWNGGAGSPRPRGRTPSSRTRSCATS